MLIEKRINCFGCRAGTLVRKIEYIHGIGEEPFAWNFRDDCANCGAFKLTHIPSGVVSYKRTEKSDYHG